MNATLYIKQFEGTWFNIAVIKEVIWDRSSLTSTIILNKDKYVIPQKEESIDIAMVARGELHIRGLQRVCSVQNRPSLLKKIQESDCLLFLDNPGGGKVI